MIRVFAIPALLAAVTVVGLSLALAGGEARHWLSWLGLGVPLAATAYHLLIRRKSDAKPPQ